MISVIVPVYNTKKYLSRCIDSILAQTYSDFELLLIDDGSTDGSGEICDEYASKDNRVHVFHQPNKGVSCARNLGLENVVGEWIAFCDADDYVSAYYLENLFRAVTRPDIDLVFNYAIVHCKGKIEKENYPSRQISVREISEMFLHNELIWHTSTWSKLFKRSIIEHERLRYVEDVHIGEDAIFLYSYILACRRINVICSCDYNYIVYGGTSLTHRINSFVSEVKGLLLITHLINKIKNICPFIPELYGKFDWLIGSYKRRSLIALYNDKICRKERLAYLNATDFTDYIYVIKEDSIQGRIYQWALAHKYYKFYDLMRIIVRYIKR